MAKTVEQIANDLNLSITTVRLVLNGKGDQYRISAKTQKKIADYVEVFGYTVNHAARSLKLNKTDTYGLVIPRLSNPFFAALAEKLEMHCHQIGCQLMISCTYGDIKNENKLVKSMDERNVDGIFIVSASRKNQQHHVKHRQKPLVFLDRDFSVSNAICVASDNCDSGAQLTKAMIQQDAPIHFFAGDALLPTIAARLRGYVQAIKAHYGDESHVTVSYAEHNTTKDGEQMMKQYLEQHRQIPSHFIASSLPILEGVLSAIRQTEGVIPAHINIGTFDDHVMLSFLPNNVWSMKQDETLLVEKAFEIMTAKIAGNVVKAPPLIKTQLIKRLIAGE